MSVDAQKLLNWIDNSDNLNDFEAMHVTIMGGENPVAKFPQQQMAVFSKEKSRRKVLSSAIGGLIKQIGRFEALEKPPVEELPHIVVAEIDDSQNVVNLAEWSDTEDWNFSSDNYWIVAKRLTSPLLGPSEKKVSVVSIDTTKWNKKQSSRKISSTGESVVEQDWSSTERNCGGN